MRTRWAMSRGCEGGSGRGEEEWHNRGEEGRQSGEEGRGQL